MRPKYFNNKWNNKYKTEIKLEFPALKSIQVLIKALFLVLITPILNKNVQKL